jgi:ubiquinone/menaquinone biosynthesis C-methylase UbiE
MLRKRLFAWFYNLMGHPKPDAPFTQDYRQPLVEQATGHVLEIGAGTGGNLPFYPPAVTHLTLLEPNPHMIGHMRPHRDRLHPAGDIVQAPGERLPFGGAAFDTVLITHVLCSVRDQAAVLAEVRRVLRPGGAFLFVEHVADAPNTFNHTMQHVINPAWKFIGDGCHLTRNTGAAIRAAGFSSLHITDFKAWGGVVGPHVIGEATV